MHIDSLIFRYLFALVAFLDVAGNSLVIVVVLRSRFMKTPISCLILNMAAADLMVGIFVVPQFVLDGTFTHPQGIGGDIFCKLITKGNLAWLSTMVSIFTLVLIAVERFFAITKPVSARYRITTGKLKFVIPICWALAVLRRIPQFYYGNVIETENGIRCIYSWPTWVTKLNIVVRLILVGLVPTTMMVVLYSRVVHHLWFKNGVGEGILFQAVRRSRRRVTIMMLTLSIIYVLFWFPDLALHVCTAFFRCSIPEVLHDSFRMLMVLNSTVNPIVYALQFQRFRKELKNVFRCKSSHSRRVHLELRT